MKILSTRCAFCPHQMGEHIVGVIAVPPVQGPYIHCPTCGPCSIAQIYVHEFEGSTIFQPGVHGSIWSSDCRWCTLPEKTSAHNVDWVDVK
jgi:hypothetical protein